MEENNLKIEAFNELVEKNLENGLANAILQSSSFVNQVLIDISKEGIDKEDLVKSITSLKDYLDAAVFEYRVKIKLSSLLDSKKKEQEELKESKSQKELLAQDL
jgi:hypothetical protein